MDPIMQLIINANKNNNYKDWKPKIRHQQEEQIIEIKKCIKCGSIMIKRPDKYRDNGWWWGCRKWPECKYTEKIK